MATVVGEKQVDISQLSIEQLNQMKGSLEQEIQALAQNYGALKEAQSRFADSKRTVSDLGETEDGNEILVPLSAALYVPGKVSNKNSLLIDVGTGYYIEKNVEDAKDYFQRKINVVEKNTASLEGIIAQKKQNNEAITMMLNYRLQAVQSSGR